MRRQIIYCLLQVRYASFERSKTDCDQEDDNPTLHIVAAFLLFDGRHFKDDAIFEMMQSECTFPRLVELVQSDTVQEDIKLHQMLLELLYESSRGQRLTYEDFSTSSSHPLAHCVCTRQ